MSAVPVVPSLPDPIGSGRLETHSPPNVPPLPAVRAKNSAELLQVMEYLRLRAAAETSAAFPGSLKRHALPNLAACSLSKARRGYRCSAAFRFGLYFLALWVGQSDRARAQRLADYAQDLVDLFWPAAAEDPLALSLIEQERQGRVDPLQLAYQGGKDEVRPELLDRLRDHRAALMAFIRSLEGQGRAVHV
jgi:hypothetical protein